jgi:hypothetical protein
MRSQITQAIFLSLSLILTTPLHAADSKAPAKTEQGTKSQKTEPAEIPLDDLTIIPGERVGPIQKGTTLFGLKTLFGGGKIKAADIYVGEGNTEPGAKLFEGTDKELEILFNQEGDEREIFDIRIIGKAWKFKNGLRLGQSLEEVEKINGKAYAIWGFGWDYGGYANFEGGTLEGKVSLRFGVKGDTHSSITGDQLVPTTNKKLRAAKPVVEQISVMFR